MSTEVKRPLPPITFDIRPNIEIKHVHELRL